MVIGVVVVSFIPLLPFFEVGKEIPWTILTAIFFFSAAGLGIFLEQHYQHTAVIVAIPFAAMILQRNSTSTLEFVVSSILITAGFLAGYLLPMRFRKSKKSGETGKAAEKIEDDQHGSEEGEQET